MYLLLSDFNMRPKSQTMRVRETHLLCLLQSSILDAPQANSWECHHSPQLEDPVPPARVEPPGERTGFPPPPLSSPQSHPCCSGPDPRELSPNALARPWRSQALGTPSTPTGWEGFFIGVKKKKRKNLGGKVVREGEGVVVD